MNIGAAKLLNQYQQVRSLYAGPVEALANQRSQAERQSHQTRERADSFSSDSRGLELGKASTQILANIWAGGGLQDAQKLAADLAAEASGNVFAGLAVATRHGLSSVLSSQDDKDGFAAEAAVLLAGAMGNDPAQYATNLNGAISREFRVQDTWLQGEVTPQALADLSVNLGERSQQAEQEAGKLYTQAKQEWNVVDNVQGQLQDRFATRRDPKLFQEKKAIAKEFFAELDTQAQQNPTVTHELQTLAKENGERFLSSAGMLTSYRAQLTRHNGDVEKLDWRKLVGQFERTSFG